MLPLSCSCVSARLALLCALLLGGAASAAEAPLTLKPAQIEALGVRTQPVLADEAGSSTRYPATVVLPDQRQRMVAAPLAGLVEFLSVSVGDSVRSGQQLAVLRSAQAQELQRDVLTSGSQATLASAALARDEQLFKEGLIAQARLEASRAQAQQAQAQQQERQRALQQAGVSGGAVGSSGVISLTAPIAGVVLERHVVVGQRVEQATAIYRIANLSTLWLEMQVPAAEAGALRLYDKVQVGEGPASGRVIGIGHAVDAASQTVLVRAELSAGATALRVGQALDAQIARAAPGVVRLPAVAVVEDGGKRVVFIEAAPGQYRVAPVELLGSSGGMAAVRGLAPGAKVVVQGTAALKSLLAAQR